MNRVCLPLLCARPGGHSVPNVVEPGWPNRTVPASAVPAPGVPTHDVLGVPAPNVQDESGEHVPAPSVPTPDVPGVPAHNALDVPGKHVDGPGVPAPS